VNIRTVRLELLRPGPPHNHLLSPLTEYLALCGDSPPETFRVPFEHYRILRTIQALRRSSLPSETDAAMVELREDVLRMLCGIRCLATSLAEAHGDGAEAIELELVLSAAELSLIPFEIAFYPGSPTRELAHREVIVTRRSRRVPRAHLTWSHRPRVLLVSASPPGFAPVPVQAHVNAIREALGPWLFHAEHYSDEERQLQELEKFLVVIPNASELSMQEAIKQANQMGRPFTHVHVLAHGDEIAGDDPEDEAEIRFREPRFGLVLHASHTPNGRDTLSGRRLFSALAGSGENCKRRLPQAVTIASCDSANVGSVVVPGASIAHDVHDGGVPLVVASQFPLSYWGSVVFAKSLYERLLGSADPRCALRETRRAVHSASTRDAGAVDWGAITQYGALPDTLDEQVKRARRGTLMHWVDSAVASVDPLVAPAGNGDLCSAWAQARQWLAALEPLKSEPDVLNFIARINLRMAFVIFQWRALMRDPDAAAVAPEGRNGWGRFLAYLNEQETGGRNTFEQGLRVYRAGILQHYRATQDPSSLCETLAADFFWPSTRTGSG
jgi:CHAT domain